MKMITDRHYHFSFGNQVQFYKQGFHVNKQVTNFNQVKKSGFKRKSLVG